MSSPHRPDPASTASPPSRLRPRLFLLTGLAAVVLLAVIARQWATRIEQQSGGAGASKWGWNRPDAFPQGLPRDAYLNHLADGAQAWFSERPNGRAALYQRLTEFRQGCSLLIRSPHHPLPEGDRTWLVAQCAARTAALGNLVLALKSGEDPTRVRAEADETINNLIAALREQSRGAG